MLMFRDSKQRADACVVLLEMKNLHRFWESPEVGANGPTEEARNELHLMDEECSRLSDGEQIILRTAFDIWDGSGHASLYQILNRIEAGVAKAIGDLFVAAANGTDLIDRWMEEWRGYDPNTEYFAD